MRIIAVFRAAIHGLATIAAVSRAAAPVLSAVLLAGCGALDGPPQPTKWWYGSWPDEPATTEQRQEEVDAYNANLYVEEGWELVDTRVTDEGNSIDWIADNAPGADVALPPASDDIALPGGVARQSTEMDGETAPLGTIPVYRNRFEVYVNGDSGASSLEDYLENHQEMGRTDGQKRLYAGFRTPTPNTGAVGWVNQFEGSVERGTFSLIEVAVSCRGPNYPHTLQQIGIVLSRDSANFGDSVLRLHVEFFTAGPKNFGKAKLGGWDHRQEGLTPVQDRRPVPGMRVDGSIVGGRQKQARLEIRFFEDKWFVGYNGDWLGYYDASLFPPMAGGSLSTGGCGASWYAEVYDPTPSTWTTTNMGSGQFAEKGRGKAAWIRNPVLFLDASNFWSSPPVDDAMTPYDPDCYTRTPLSPQTDGKLWLFLGGPGGDAPGGACK